jgi:hypothetical protein
VIGVFRGICEPLPASKLVALGYYADLHSAISPYPSQNELGSTSRGRQRFRLVCFGPLWLWHNDAQVEPEGAKNAGLPNLHRFVIEFRLDHCHRMVRKKTMLAQIPRPIGAIAFASTLLASALGVSMPGSMALAVDCLGAPNSSAPPHSHWYYRTDPTRQHKCWHLGADNAPAQQAAVQTAVQAPPAKSSPSVLMSGPYSLASFKEFMAQNGGAKLSNQDLERLYAEFLEWKHRANN